MPLLRRKTIIVLTITFMVTLMVSSFSYLYISQILRLRIDNAHETAKQLAHQLAYAAENDVPDFSSTNVDTNDPVAVRRALLPGRLAVADGRTGEVAEWLAGADAAAVCTAAAVGPF